MTVNSNENGPNGSATVAPKPEPMKAAASGAAHDVREEVTHAVSDVKSEAATQIGNVKDDVRTKAEDLFGQAREQFATQAEQGTHQLAESLVSAGQELSQMAEHSEQADGPMTGVVRRVGNRTTEMGERFKSGGYKALASDLTGFARANPGVFLLATAGAGFAVGRIVRNADTKAIMSATRADESQVPAGAGVPSPAALGGEVPPVPALTRPSMTAEALTASTHGGV